MGIIVESTDGNKLLNVIIVLAGSITVSVGCIVSAVNKIVDDGRTGDVLLGACVSPGNTEVDNVGDVISDVVNKVVISSDILSTLETVKSTLELVGSRIDDDVIYNDVIVTLVMSIITEDNTMDSRGDDVIITGVTSLDNSVLSEDKCAVVVNEWVPSTVETEISDDGLSKDVRGATVDNEVIVGLAVNMLVIDTVVTATCSVVTVVGPINDSKLLSVIKSTTLEE